MGIPFFPMLQLEYTTFIVIFFIFYLFYFYFYLFLSLPLLFDLMYFKAYLGFVKA